MDVLFLSRLQFAAATMFHFLFVPLNVGAVRPGCDYGDEICPNR